MERKVNFGNFGISISFLSLIHVFFFLVFCSVTILNHFYFRTAALDYGIANQALYQYAHFKPAICTVLIEDRNMPYLGLHLSLWVPLLSPFYFLFGSYTLLLFQNLALVFCGMGIVKMARYLKASNGLILFVVIQFYSSFAIYSALAFDYHDNVIGACFLPWLFYFYHQEEKLKTLLCFIAVLISKENMAIWMGFAVFTLWFTKKSLALWFPISLFLLAVSWFFIAGMLIMPALNPAGKFEQLSRYSHLGSDMGSIITYVFMHPREMLKMFFQSHIQPDNYDVVKQEFLWVVLISGGVALLFKPSFLWMALPILMQKLWNKELAFWGISYHYQIELPPIIALAILFLLVKFKIERLQLILACFLMMGTMITTYSYMQIRNADYNPVKENIFSKAHYLPTFDVDLVRNKLIKLTSGETVCAQSNLIPHLEYQTALSHFPNLRNSNNLVFLEPGLNSYPLAENIAVNFIDSIRKSGNWQEDSSAMPLRILSRKD